MAHMSRREYRMKKEHGQGGADQSRVNYAKNKANSREEFRSKKLATLNLLLIPKLIFHEKIIIT
ncbi:hypothetical protein LhelvAHU1049_19110 [Lactobacillus helveticus]|nr:hypothetical protein LhelvAHU1049_19110 [Lactobacillus helveticus]